VVADADVAIGEPPPAKKKRKKPAKLTQFALTELKKRAWHAQVVEKWIPMIKRKVDLFNVIDIVAIRPEYAGLHPRQEHDGDGPCAACSRRTAIVGIQVTGTSSTTSGGSVGAHRTKILAEPRAKAWVDAGGELELWVYRKVGNRWKLTIETYAEMAEAAR
jgi:hypothetical protein